MTTPPQHNIGDTGHTTDHNTISTLLTSLGVDVTALQASLAATMAKTDNSVTIADQVSWVLRVSLPTGSRGTAPPVIQLFNGTTLVAGFNAYGEVFAGPATPSRPGFVVTGLPGQTADLQQWSASNATVLARISSSGALSAPAVTATGAVTGATVVATGAMTAGISLTVPFVTTGDSWRQLIPGAGWTNSGTGPKLQYRKIASPPNTVDLIGDLLAGTLTNSTTIATLPAGYIPVSNQAFPVAIAGASPTTPGLARLSVSPAGQLQCNGLAGIGGSRVAFHALISLDA